MHPRWAFGDALAAFLEPLREAGLQALEFGLEAHDADWPRFLPLIKDCRQLGFALCFHAPYRLPYTIAGFAGRERAEIEAAYAPMLDIAVRFGPATVVVHGARSTTRLYEEVYADTIAFLEWALEQYPTLTFALENLNPDPGQTKVGTERVEVLRIVQEIDAPNLGICWDMGHDVQAGRLYLPDTAPRAEPRDEAWLRHVRHVHVHDIDEQGIDHYPLIHGQVPYQVWLPALVATGFEGIATLEIKGGQLMSLEVAQIMEMLVESIGEIHRFLGASNAVTGGGA
jgi:sugar phosphate isomerase/epimerase